MDDIQINRDSEEQSMSEQMLLRREKLKALKEAGKDPYTIVRYDRTALAADVRRALKSLTARTFPSPAGL